MAPPPYGPEGIILTKSAIPEVLRILWAIHIPILQNVFCKTAKLINEESGFRIAMRGITETCIILNLYLGISRSNFRGENYDR
jgi:hypothetical protein